MLLRDKFSLLSNGKVKFDLTLVVVEIEDVCRVVVIGQVIFKAFKKNPNFIFIQMIFVMKPSGRF